MNSKLDFLSLQDLLDIGQALIPDFRVRDVGLLESACRRPQTTVFGESAYPSFPEKIAALMHSLARNHALVDGNKRIAWSAGRIFALLNGRDLSFSVDEAEEMIQALARGDLDVPGLARILDERLGEISN